MLYDITPPKRILFNVGIAFISPLPRCRDNFSNVPTDNHGRFMNFYSATFKICDTRSEVFRLSGYFEIPRRYFCRLLITLIPLKPLRIVSLHFSPFLQQFYVFSIIPVKIRSNMDKKLMEYFRYHRAQLPA